LLRRQALYPLSYGCIAAILYQVCHYPTMWYSQTWMVEPLKLRQLAGRGGGLAGLNTQPFGFSVAEVDGTATVKLSGEIDYAASLAIGPKLDQIADHASGILFDLDRVTLIDSEGIKMILCATQTVRMKNRRAEIVRCNDRVDRILKLAGVHDCLVSGSESSGGNWKPHLPWRS
jgi:anti-anti-sigma factor